MTELNPEHQATALRWLKRIASITIPDDAKDSDAAAHMDWPQGLVPIITCGQVREARETVLKIEGIPHD